jgi:DMSO/TMAO reductase YedYZ molybdopterin-dependent catalytic subunit
MTDLRGVREPARVAAVDEGISAEEPKLAARNHGLPLEALSFDVTPVGLHCLLVHYDIPVIDRAGFRLVVDGLVDRSLSLDLDAIRRRPRVSAVVMLECAGQLEPPGARPARGCHHRQGRGRGSPAEQAGHDAAHLGDPGDGTVVLEGTAVCNTMALTRAEDP